MEQILESVAKRKSPVSGKSFPALSKDYAKQKAEEGLPPVPNLEFEGDMLDSLTFVTTEEGIRIGVFGDDAPKADGHNNLSGKSDLPLRRFIPDEGEGFISKIEREVDAIIADSIAENTEPDVEQLSSISSKASLYRVLSEVFTSLDTQTEIRAAVLRSPIWLEALEELDLIKWL